MSKATALARQALRDTADHARMVIVLASALALILAGDALPLSL